MIESLISYICDFDDRQSDIEAKSNSHHQKNPDCPLILTPLVLCRDLAQNQFESYGSLINQTRIMSIFKPNSGYMFISYSYVIQLFQSLDLVYEKLIQMLY
ncbi:UNKNOWN [Stylonychia lemnae]|uniref:Uncharacterized protein n=1 Tax=Stylonychia lemnae TaxID=5949 RepID=A0A078BBA3_STYLE|nr:UNKNOWN [Stylonychia lemnae]|eukprot:CDW90537.1 UNKNOWN [Stylonychia lemnae]